MAPFNSVTRRSVTAVLIRCDAAVVESCALATANVVALVTVVIRMISESIWM